jgi:hypothetical protein
MANATIDPGALRHFAVGGWNSLFWGLSDAMAKPPEEGVGEQCMVEYDLNGWTVPDLFNNHDVSIRGDR